MFVQSNFDKQVPTWSIAPGVEEKKKSTIYVKDIQRATFPVADRESIMIPSSLGDTKEIYWMLTQICYVNIFLSNLPTWKPGKPYIFRQ